jgi:phospholipase A1
MRSSISIYRSFGKAICACGLLAVFSGFAWADPTASMLDCRGIKDDAQRLQCYDALREESREAPATAPANQPNGGSSETQPALEQRLEKERDLARRAFAIVPYRPNYILHTYNSDPNVTPYLAVDPNTDFQYQEIKFQISLRVPLYNKMFGDNGDLWFGYTQLSFWQAYNWAQSAPFRETNYEPELGLSFHTNFSVLGFRHRLLSVGLVHQSNGRTDPLSRSWNRFRASFQLERGALALTFQPWYRFPESAKTDNNPDILDYAGRMETRVSYKRGEQVFSLQWRNNLQTRKNRSGTEYDWSFPLSKRLKGLVQYYSGYGESLIDYNVRTRRLGVGVLVEDWL